LLNLFSLQAGENDSGALNHSRFFSAAPVDGDQARFVIR